MFSKLLIVFLVATSVVAAAPLPKCSEMKVPIELSIFPFMSPAESRQVELRINCSPFEPELCVRNTDGFQVWLVWSSPSSSVFSAGGLSASNFDPESGIIFAASNAVGKSALAQDPLAKVQVVVTLQQECDYGIELYREDLVTRTFIFANPQINSIEPQHIKVTSDIAVNQSITLHMDNSDFGSASLSSVFNCAWQTEQDPVLMPAKPIERSNTHQDGRKLDAFDFSCQVPPQFIADFEAPFVQHWVHLTYSNNTYSSTNSVSLLLSK